jgi:hypothetical protein
MEASGRFNASAALCPKKAKPISLYNRLGETQQPVWTL